MSREPVKEVVFKVSRPDGQYGLHKLADTVFSLGWGPCGRYVTSLVVEVTDVLLKVSQVSLSEDLAEVHLEHTESHLALIGHKQSGNFRNPDLLLPAHLVEWHKERMERCRTVVKKVQDGREIKEFIYKIADVHGRIVTTK